MRRCAGLSLYVRCDAADRDEGAIRRSLSWSGADADPDCAADRAPVCLLLTLLTTLDRLHTVLENIARTGVCRSVTVSRTLILTGKKIKVLSEP